MHIVHVLGLVSIAVHVPPDIHNLITEKLSGLNREPEDYEETEQKNTRWSE